MSKSKMVKIRDATYDVAKIKYIYDLPEVYNKYVERAKLEIYGERWLELTPALYWNFINTSYFPLNLYKLYDEPKLAISSMRNKTEQAKELENSDEYFASVLKSKMMTTGVHRIYKKAERENINYIKPKYSAIQNMNPMINSFILKEKYNSSNFCNMNHQSENDTFKSESKFLNEKLSVSVDKDSSSWPEDNINIDILISYFTKKMGDYGKDTDDTVKIWNLKHSRSDSNVYDFPELLTADLKATYDYVEEYENPYERYHYPAYSRDYELIDFIEKQYSEKLSRRFASLQNNDSFIKEAYMVDLSFERLKELPTCFLHPNDICHICCKSDYEDDNLLVYWDQWNWLTHQKCSNIETVPEGSWYWNKWKVFEKEYFNLIQWSLCLGYSGFMQPTNFLSKYSLSEIRQQIETNQSTGVFKTDDLQIILEVEKQKFVKKIKDNKIFGSVDITPHFHWVHLSCCNYRLEIPRMTLKSAIDLTKLKLTDLNTTWYIWQKHGGVTHKCTKCVKRFHYECGRKLECSFKIRNQKSNKCVFARWTEHKSKFLHDEFNNQTENYSIEMAEAWITIETLLNEYKLEDEMKKCWTQKHQSLLEDEVACFIKNLNEAQFLFCTDPSDKIAWKKNAKELFKRIIEKDAIDWTQLTMREFTLNFVKYQFFKNKKTPSALAKFLAKHPEFLKENISNRQNKHASKSAKNPFVMF